MQELLEAIDNKDVPKIKHLMKEHNLVLDGNKIIPKDKAKIKSDADYWDTMQYIRK
jgi:hypothetical protein